MRRKSKKRGMILPLTFLAIISVMGLVMTMSNLNQGVKNQIYRTNNHQLSFLIAYSAFSRVCAKVHAFSWANRPFSSEPYTENKVSLFGGKYDLLVEDSIGKPYQADIYIRTHLAGISRMFFWRIKYNEDLLDISNNILVELFDKPDPSDFPDKIGPRPVADKLEDILQKRTDNQKKSDQLASEIKKINDQARIIEKIGARPAEGFDNNYPGSSEDDVFSNRPLQENPEIGPPPTIEKPSNPGPNRDSLVNPNSGMAGADISVIANSLLSASEKLYENTDKGWTEVENLGVDGISSAQQYWELAAAAKNQMYNDLERLLEASKDGINDAPSQGAIKAIQEQVSQTMAAAINNIAKTVKRSFDHLEQGGTSHLDSLPTSGDVEVLLGHWEGAKEVVENDLANINRLASEISGYSMPNEAASAISEAIASVQKSLELIKSRVVAAETRLAQLKETEQQFYSGLEGATF